MVKYRGPSTLHSTRCASSLFSVCVLCVACGGSSQPQDPYQGAQPECTIASFGQEIVTDSKARSLKRELFPSPSQKEARQIVLDAVTASYIVEGAPRNISSSEAPHLLRVAMRKVEGKHRSFDEIFAQARIEAGISPGDCF